MSFEDEYDEYGFHPQSLASRWLKGGFRWWEPPIWLILIVPFPPLFVARMRSLYFQRKAKRASRG